MTSKFELLELYVWTNLYYFNSPITIVGRCLHFANDVNTEERNMTFVSGMKVNGRPL